jgi:hypothetical protein
VEFWRGRRRRRGRGGRNRLFLRGLGDGDECWRGLDGVFCCFWCIKIPGCVCCGAWDAAWEFVLL